MTLKKCRINVSFSEKDFEIIDYWSKRQGQSFSSFVRFLVKESLERKFKTVIKKNND